MTSIIKVNEIQDAGGNTILSSNGTGTFTSNLPSAVNTPAFHARLSVEPSIANNTTTKLQFTEEVLDTNNCYDNASNYRFTPTTAGKYFIYSGVSGVTADQQQLTLDIYVNGSRRIFHRGRGSGSSNMSVFTSGIIPFNGTTDYAEVYLTHEFGSSTIALAASGIDFSFFGGYKIIGA